MKMKIKYLLFFLMLLSVYSCKRNIVLTGSVQGRVSLLTAENGDTLSLGGIKVKLISSEYGERDTVTDAHGYFNFSGVQTGSYEIITGEEPIGEYHRYIEYVGGESPYVLSPVKLTYRSQTEPYEIAVDGHYLIVKFRPSASEGNPKYLKIFYKEKGQSFVSNDIVESETDFCRVYMGQGTYEVKAYGVSIGDHSVYYDTTGNVIDPGLSKKYIEKTITIE